MPKSTTNNINNRAENFRFSSDQLIIQAMQQLDNPIAELGHMASIVSTLMQKLSVKEFTEDHSQITLSNSDLNTLLFAVYSVEGRSRDLLRQFNDACEVVEQT